MSIVDALFEAAAGVPGGRYAVAVSGGADSVGLLLLLRQRRPDLQAHVVHLDHQTRGAESTGDAEFVRRLAAAWGLARTVARRDEIEPLLERRPANTSAFYRAMRLELYRRVVAEHGLDAVLLAHHADDQAETVLHRLLRGSGAAGLGGMGREARVGGVRLLRPLLEVPREAIREYLREMGQTWREDASNASDKYFRNRLRKALKERPDLKGRLLELARSAGELGRWVGEAAPKLGATFRVAELRGWPRILAEAAGRRWLRERGVPGELISAAGVGKLLMMAGDAASAARQDFAGGVVVRRRGGRILAERREAE